jgi:hypothetical protein
MFEDLDLPGGPFDRHEVYFEHDGPRLLSLRARRWPMFYMLNCVEEDDNAGTLTYLAVVLDQTRFDAVRGGELDLRSAYVEAGVGDVHSIVWEFDEETMTATPTVETVSGAVADDWLPRPGAALALGTPTAVLFDEAELDVLAESGLRSVGAIELGQRDQPLTEFSLRGLSHIGNSIQDNVDALADEGYEGRHNKPSEEVQLAAIGLRAASFVILVGTDKRGRLTERTDLFVSVFDEFVNLVAAGADPESGELIERLSTHQPRTRRRFRQLLKRLVEAESGLTVHANPLGHARRTAALSYSKAVGSLEAMAAVPDEVTTVNIKRGSLLALNLTRRTFEIHDLASAKKYSGHMSDEARAQADGLRVSESSVVGATVEMAAAFASDDERARCTLLKVQSLG